MRAFVERTNGDVRGWIQANRPDWFDEDWDQYLPTTLDDPSDGFTGFDGVYQQLGPWALTGNGSEPANRGCNVEGPGARTYWVPKDVNDRWEDRQRYGQDGLDEKVLVCVTDYLLAAFCAWDGGGRLADLGGSVLEWLGPISNGSAGVFWNGSWEKDHPTQNSGLPLPALYKYYASGGRCARN